MISSCIHGNTALKVLKFHLYFAANLPSKHGSNVALQTAQQKTFLGFWPNELIICSNDAMAWSWGHFHFSYDLCRQISQDLFMRILFYASFCLSNNKDSMSHEVGSKKT